MLELGLQRWEVGLAHPVKRRVLDLAKKHSQRPNRCPAVHDDELQQVLVLKSVLESSFSTIRSKSAEPMQSAFAAVDGTSASS